MQHLEEEHRQLLAELRGTYEQRQTHVAQLEGAQRELREANQAVLVVARHLERARKEGEERILTRSRTLLEPFIKSLMQNGETIPYGVQLDLLLMAIEGADAHVTTSFAAGVHAVCQ